MTHHNNPFLDSRSPSSHNSSSVAGGNNRTPWANLGPASFDSIASLQQREPDQVERHVAIKEPTGSSIDQSSHILDDTAEEHLRSQYLLDETSLSTSAESGQLSTDITNSSKVVLRRVPKMNFTDTAAARREIKALGAISDPSILRLIEWREFQSSIWLVTEFRPAESLEQFVRTHHPLSADEIKSLVTQLFAGLAVIFNAGYSHLRITNETLLVDTFGRLIFGGFGFVHEYDLERIEDLYAATNERHGSDIYTAPEVFASIKYNARKAAMWSCGVVLYFICTAQTDRLSTLAHPTFEQSSEISPPRRKMSTASQQALKVPVVAYPDRFAVPAYMRDIISKMLQVEPTRRAELIEVAAKVPKEITIGKEPRPLMELAWLDYKSHVGPYAGLGQGATDSSSLFSFGGTSVFSRDSLAQLMPGRRKSSIGKVSDTVGTPSRRRSFWR